MEKPLVLPKDARVQIVISLLNAEISSQRSLEALAAAVNLSSSRLRHLFKANTGLTPAEYVKDLRLRKAKELLETTFLSLKEIMNRVGVRDHSHFARDFKNTYGLSPGKYRNQYGRGATHSHGEEVATLARE